MLIHKQSQSILQQQSDLVVNGLLCTSKSQTENLKVWLDPHPLTNLKRNKWLSDTKLGMDTLIMNEKCSL